MLPDCSTWEKLKEFGIVKWIEDKKASGAIGKIGFSFHGATDDFLGILDAYEWDFCQIQYNYMDENSQAGRKGLLAAYDKNIPVIIMEPLRGGNLTNNLCKEAKEIFEKTGESPAQWALRWLYAQKEVSCVLSGMNNMAVLDENIEGASREACFSEADKIVIEEVKEAIASSLRILCTGCSYCMPCPAGVDIPGCFRCYNVSYSESFGKAVKEYMNCTTFRRKLSNASQCVGCGRCEKVCPQSIPIRQALTLVKERMEKPFYKVIASGSRLFFK